MNHYFTEGFDIFQIHPHYGRRLVRRADGHGQDVELGELEGSLFVLEVWRVYGDKNGSISVMDPETLAVLMKAFLDIDCLQEIGFDQEGRFVICEGYPHTGFRWRGYCLPGWQTLGEIQPVAAAIRDIRALLSDVKGTS